MLENSPSSGNAMIIEVEFVQMQSLYIGIEHASEFGIKKTSMFSRFRAWSVLKLRIAEGSSGIHDARLFSAPYIQYIQGEQDQ